MWLVLTNGKWVGETYTLYLNTLRSYPTAGKSLCFLLAPRIGLQPSPGEETTRNRTTAQSADQRTVLEENTHHLGTIGLKCGTALSDILHHIAKPGNVILQNRTLHARSLDRYKLSVNYLFRHQWIHPATLAVSMCVFFISVSTKKKTYSWCFDTK